jgi:hypothetical protein
LWSKHAWNWKFLAEVNSLKYLCSHKTSNLHPNIKFLDFTLELLKKENHMKLLQSLWKRRFNSEYVHEILKFSN